LFFSLVRRKTDNSDCWTCQVRAYVPPIAVRLRWMGHPSFGVWLERTGNGENGRRRSGCGGEVAGEAAGGELCAVGEAAEGAEAVCGGETDEIKAGDGGLEVCVEDRGVVDGFDLTAEVRIEEVDPLQRYLVAGCGYDVVDVELLGGVVVLVQVQDDSVAVLADLFEGGPEVHGYVADYFAPGKPAGGGAVYFLNGAEAELHR